MPLNLQPAKPPIESLAASSESLATPTPATPLALSRLNSAQLLGGQRMVEIEHGDQRYTLRVTRENKLILTK